MGMRSPLTVAATVAPSSGVVIATVGGPAFTGATNEASGRIVGGFTLLFLAQRLLFPPRPDAPPPPRWAGAMLTMTSGFTSFVAHAGGPPLNAYVVPLRLSPVLFTGTMAFLFFFVNLAKWVPYGWLGLLNGSNLGTSLVLLPLAPVGVWIGVRIARRIQPTLFYRFIYGGMAFTGCKLIWDALA